ncbi:MAG: EAL domain-containing protein, partial [Candidatus Thiodiazotropha sp.]
EESGLIRPIGEWILRQACQQAAKWRTKGLSPERISVNCNFTASQLNCERFIEGFLNFIDVYEIVADLLELEITLSIN